MWAQRKLSIMANIAMANVTTVPSLAPKHSTLSLVLPPKLLCILNDNRKKRAPAQHHLLVKASHNITTDEKPGGAHGYLKAGLRNAALVAANSLIALPAFAEKMEKAALFDFNLTLPIIAAEFLLLMVALDNIWFKPIGKFMDDRDESIRQKIISAREMNEEARRLQEEAEARLKAARAEVTAALNKMKKEMAQDLDKKLQESRQRVEKELALALENLERQKQETLQSLDQQIEALSEEIVSKVLPFKI